MKPRATQPSDLILVVLTGDNPLKKLTQEALAPLGWTLLDAQSQYGLDGQSLYILHKRAGPNEPVSLVLEGINDPDYAVGVQGLLLVFRGVNAENPIHGFATKLTPTGANTGTGVHTETPALTTTVPGCVLIVGLAPDSAIDAPLVTSWPTGFAKRQWSVNNPPKPFPYGWANLYVALRTLPAASALPASAFDWSIRQGNAYHGAATFMVALSP